MVNLKIADAVLSSDWLQRMLNDPEEPDSLVAGRKATRSEPAQSASPQMKASKAEDLECPTSAVSRPGRDSPLCDSSVRASQTAEHPVS